MFWVLFREVSLEILIDRQFLLAVVAHDFLFLGILTVCQVNIWFPLLREGWFCAIMLSVKVFSSVIRRSVNPFLAVEALDFVVLVSLAVGEVDWLAP